MTAVQSDTQAATVPQYGLWTFLALLALLGLRLVALWFNQTDLFFDEAQYWVWGQEPAFGYFSKPPMIAWVIGGVTSLCGDGPFCARLASPLLHFASALFIFGAAKTLYDARIGAWSAIVYATLPGISYSAGIISTDVPLLFFWSAALLGWAKLMQMRSFGWALWLAVAIGLGLLAKYAMAYFYLCLVLFLLIDRDSRWLATRVHGLALLVIPPLFLVPNVLWNLDHGFVTLTHTAANAKWGGSLFHPNKALEFFGAQFGVFGPILMGVLIAILVRFRDLDRTGRMLVAFSVPVILLITVQAFLSRANANWAAVAYPAAAILVTATMLRLEWRRLFRASLILHLIVVALIGVGSTFAPSLALPGRPAPYARVLGWPELANAVRAKWDEGRYSAILTEDRMLSAELLYYLRDSGIRIVSWRPETAPRDHFELTRPYRADVGGPVLLVTLRPSVGYVTSRFAVVDDLGTVAVPSGPGSERVVRFFALKDFKGQGK